MSGLDEKISDVNSGQLGVNDLSRLDLGALAAENDAGLVEYFVRTEAFNRIADSRKWIVLGSRGVGKTAIFRGVADEKGRAKSLIVNLAPEDYSYELARDLLAREAAGSWQKSGAFAVAWKWLILVLVMRGLAESGARARTKPEGKLYAFLRDRFESVAENPIDALISYLKRIESVKIGKWEAGLQAKELQRLFKLDELAPALDDLKLALENRPAFVFVDELDRGWDASEDAQYFVAGLFRACIGLNQTYPGLHVLMSLRQELYDSIPSLYEDAQKHRDVIETIGWDEPRLLRLVAERIRRSFPEFAAETDEAVWSRVFSDVLSYRTTKSFNYLVDRTLYRPRELILFATFVRDVAQENKQPVDYAVVAEAERSYSKARFDDITSEYRFQYPGLARVLERFRGELYRMDRSELEEKCITLILGGVGGDADSWLAACEPLDLIQVLWEVGFLTARVVGGQKGVVRSGSQYVGSHQVPALPLDGVQTFRVHPMFHSYLGLKEKGRPGAAGDEV
jgi:hypothetical protein